MARDTYFLNEAPSAPSDVTDKESCMRLKETFFYAGLSQTKELFFELGASICRKTDGGLCSVAASE